MAERKEVEDEFNPRHRIVGAVILVALAVIFLPMVLNDEPPSTVTAPSIETPVADSVPTAPPADGAAPAVTDPDHPTAPPRTTRIVTVPVEPMGTALPPDRRTGTSTARPAPAPSTAPPAAAIEPARVEPPAAPAAGATRTTVAAAPRATTSGGWIVQVGVFSQADNARRLQERLNAKGYAVTLDPPGAPKGKAVRVEVGPYKDQAAAKSAAARIERDFDIHGIVRTQ